MVKTGHGRLLTPARHLFRALTGGLAGRTSEAREIVSRVRENLGGVSSATEGVFLLVGERLTNLQCRVREIASEASEIAELQANDAGSLLALDEILRAACGDWRDNGTGALIGKIEENADAVLQAIQAIGPVVKTFDSLERHDAHRKRPVRGR
jgi:hypothetical protein